MSRVVAIIGNESAVSDLQHHLTTVDGVEPSDIDDWNAAGSSLDAPFNPWNPVERLAAVTATFDDGALSAVIDRLLDARQALPASEDLLLLDPWRGEEIGRVYAGASVDDVERLLERAPSLDGQEAMLGGERAQIETSVGVTGSAERQINIWIGDDPHTTSATLTEGMLSPINFMVGEAVPASAITGSDVQIPDSDVPVGGLDTSWVVLSSDLELAASSPGTSAESGENSGTPLWTAKFDLHIPHEGNSGTVQLTARALNPDIGHLSVLIFAGAELYRQVTVALHVCGAADTEPTQRSAVTVEEDALRTPVAHLAVRPTHEWTTPPERLSITIFGDTAILAGTSMGPDAAGTRTWTTENGQRESWAGVAARVSAPIDNVIADAEGFRKKHEAYLNDIPRDDVLARLANPPHQYDWGSLHFSADAQHEQAWKLVETSDELWGMAKSGRVLYDRFFLPGTRLRKVIEYLEPGYRIDIDWQPQGNYVPHVPWGLLYLGNVPDRGKPVDPSGFFGLRFRMGYTSHPMQGGASKALGTLGSAYGAHLMYEGSPSSSTTDAIAEEAQWQRTLWTSWVNQTVVPTGGTDPSSELRTLLANPTPTPLAVLYLYCQTGGKTGDPLLRFGPPANPCDLTRHDLGDTQIMGGPLVFANACTTAAADPYVASMLEETFFTRGCRGYIGTETKVPITLASRFALIFFEYFYRQIAPEPIAAGEAVAQARLFLWTHYRNLGGLFYSHVNIYELFMADDSEIRALRQ